MRLLVLSALLGTLLAAAEAATGPPPTGPVRCPDYSPDTICIQGDTNDCTSTGQGCTGTGEYCCIGYCKRECQGGDPDRPIRPVFPPEDTF